MASNNRKKNVRKTYNREKKDTSTKYNKPTRLLGLTVLLVVLMFTLVFRIGWLQFVQGASLKEAATKQQTTSRIISPNRGSIYDSTGKPLAISANVDTVTINPQKFIVEDSPEETVNLQEKVSKAFSEIFELDYEEVHNKVISNSSIQTIAKKVEEDKINKLKDWMDENKIYAGINIDTDTKRYYYYSIKLNWLLW